MQSFILTELFLQATSGTSNTWLKCIQEKNLIAQIPPNIIYTLWAFYPWEEREQLFSSKHHHSLCMASPPVTAHHPQGPDRDREQQALHVGAGKSSFKLKLRNAKFQSQDARMDHCLSKYVKHSFLRESHVLGWARATQGQTPSVQSAERLLHGSSAVNQLTPTFSSLTGCKGSSD